jgi:hydrophobic/amphiphilic exporter-1 (mainly G- bacteria), HAE1 family
MPLWKISSRGSGVKSMTVANQGRRARKFGHITRKSSDLGPGLEQTRRVAAAHSTVFSQRENRRKFRSAGFRAAPLALFLLPATVVFAAGCGSPKAALPIPSPEVEMASVIQKDVPIYSEWVATLDGYVNAQAFMGGYFINYFNRFGRQWQVYIEAEGDYRTQAENVGQFYVRNNKGGMVPLSSVTRFESRDGPEFTMRFNEYRAAQINGAAAPGYSADQAMAALEDVFRKTMPREMGFDYLGMSFQEKKAREGVPAAAIFGFSLLFVFLILAGLYESWSLPFSVLLSTPVAIFGAFLVLWLRRTVLSAFLPSYMVQIESDVYSQIGLVMLIGLAAKNAILIVQFAKEQYEHGKPLVDAALEGARLRLRPILMTSFAFILGAVPLWTASGAGAVARQIMGTAVIGGMLAASLVGIFFIPAMFYLIEKWSGAGHRISVLSAPNAPAEAD